MMRLLGFNAVALPERIYLCAYIEWLRGEVVVHDYCLN
jgi:hypothetical protein